MIRIAVSMIHIYPDTYQIYSKTLFAKNKIVDSNKVIAGLFFVLVLCVWSLNYCHLLLFLSFWFTKTFE